MTHRIMNTIAELAAAFRRALDLLPGNLRPIALRDFPRGSCGDASDLLGTYLVERGLGPFEWVSADRTAGCNGWQCQTHVWLRQNALIVDITADQFEEGRAPVIVTYDSPWHRSWIEQRSRVADFRKAGSIEFVALNRAYVGLIREADARLCNVVHSAQEPHASGDVSAKQQRS